ncbi:aminotransferase class IV [Haloferula rosea]|uniref:branched-chain-amino-acid transaminase n=1 Tax=Haloferula rosea TaxID=490093 RepID=A0A934VGD0_9BACT|nr:aminotransferase class IV [Haloferula rosea]MBK1827480.1 aminotransferase class IV family protein [Haloferula rosea]
MSSWLLEGSGDWLDDRALSHGMGVFETLLVVEGSIVDAPSHRQRMEDGCERMGLRCPDWRVVAEAIQQHSAEFEDGMLRGRVMRSAGEGGLASDHGENEKTVLTLVPWTEGPRRLKVATAPWARDERSPLAGVKCTSYAENLMALRMAAGQGDLDELLFANSKGDWCEGTTSNGFAVIGGELVTPSLDSGCLPGTMRSKVLRWASELGIPCRERRIPMQELGEASEIFLTSAIRGVVPVVEFDQKPWPEGEVCRGLQGRWRRLVGLDRS